jgi:hypothetical protein
MLLQRSKIRENASVKMVKFLGLVVSLARQRGSEKKNASLTILEPLPQSCRMDGSAEKATLLQLLCTQARDTTRTNTSTPLFPDADA